MGGHKKIRFTGAGASHQNGTLERDIKTKDTLEMAILMNDDLRCTEDTFSTDVCPIETDYDIWIYNQIPYMRYG